MARRRFDFVSWFLVAIALVALACAGLMASAAPPSVCEQDIRINADIAAIPFLLFVAAGAWAVVRATATLRLLFFLGISVVLAGYVAGLTLSFDLVVADKVRCMTNAGKLR